MSNAGLYLMVFKKKLIIGKKFMRCYNSMHSTRDIFLVVVTNDFGIFFARKLVVPGDLRSYGGGNGLPRAVKQSPNFSQILEEDEDEDEDEEEEEEAEIDSKEQKLNVSILLVSIELERSLN
jgi:hypothetical protein